MKKINALLVALISTLAITGLSFIDDQIWNVIFLIVGIAAYAIVGVLFSLGVLHGRQSGRDAYALVFFLLILGGWGVYQGLVAFKKWVISWPMALKIIVPSLIALAIGAVVFLIVWRKRKGEKQLSNKTGDVMK